MGLILANALFVLGEFALVAVDRNRVEARAREGDRLAGRVRLSLRRLSFELSGAQLGITITSIALGFVGEPVISDLLEPAFQALPGVDVEPGSGVSVLVALAIATIAQMVLGELVPKSWAIARPLGTARAVVLPFGWFAVVFGPLITVLNGAANRVVRIFGVEPRDELAAVRSLDELDLLIRSSVREGALEATTYPLLSRALAFGDRTVAETLVPRVAIDTLGRDATVAQLVESAARTGHSRFPVHDGDIDDMVGVVHVKDAARFPRETWGDTTIEELLTEAPVVPQSRDLASLFTEMRSTGQHLAIVVDEYGGTAGIVTVEDVLEEIVGEIEDEHDARGPTTVSSGRGTVVSGMWHAAELEEQVGFRLPEGDYETVAGFVLAELGHIPARGERFERDGWLFEVASMDGRRIERVRVTPPPGFHWEAPPGDGTRDDPDGLDGTQGDGS